MPGLRSWRQSYRDARARASVLGVSDTRQEPARDSERERELSAWPILRVRVPREWKVWLEEAADARALSVAALVRQCIRSLMITRHENGES